MLAVGCSDGASALAGAAIALDGIGLRVWAILILGRFFKFAVVIQHGHTVTDHGPYRHRQLLW